MSFLRRIIHGIGCVLCLSYSVHCVQSWAWTWDMFGWKSLLELLLIGQMGNIAILGMAAMGLTCAWWNFQQARYGPGKNDRV